MDMQVRHRLAAVRAVVDHDAEARLAEAFAFRHRAGGEEQVAKEFGVLGFRLADARDDGLRHDQKMRGRLRVDVTEGQAPVVLVKNLRGNFPRYDAFEDGHDS